MNFNIQAKNFELTDALHSHFMDKVVQKLGKIIDLDDGAVSVFAEISKTTGAHNADDLYHASLEIHIGGGDYYSKEEMSDMYSAIDKVCDEVFHMIRRDTKKLRDVTRREESKIKKLLRKIGL